MLTISDLTYRIAGRTLLDATTVQIADGWKVGLIGRNGAGKSTLLELIRGTLQPDGGEVSLPNGARIGFVAQEAPAGKTTPLEMVVEADERRTKLFEEAETTTDGLRVADIHEALAAIDAHSAPARAAGILNGLGFDHEAQNRPLSTFSGGWRMRVALAAALFSEPDVLLLDEPTNHLDLEASIWLAEFLRRYPKTLLLVSHDRQFLDEVADHILHLGELKLTLYTGGYEAFTRLRRETMSRQKSLASRQESERKRLQDFVDRFRAKATKARQAQSRIKALAKLEPISLSAEEPPVRFVFPEPQELAPPLVNIDRAAVGYETGKPILSHLDLRLDPDDRIALLGANGNGKSTFARLLAGRLQPSTGEVRRAPRFRCGYFAQHQIEELDPKATPFDHLTRLMPKATPEAVRARLARFGFGVDKVFVDAEKLSGGEKARLTFAIMTVDAPPLLILDEPTNHLDIEAREALVQAINEFAGAVVLISHDWHLLSLTADRLWMVGDGTVKPYDGDLEDYRRALLAPSTSSEPPLSKAEKKQRRDDRKASAGRRREIEPLRKEVRATEKIMSDLTAKKKVIDDRLADPTTYEGGAGIEKLLREQADLAASLAAAEAKWMAAAQAMEEAESDA